MRRHDIDFQILFEIGHVLSDIGKRCFPTETSTPSAPVSRNEHDVVGRLDRGGKASGDDDALLRGGRQSGFRKSNRDAMSC
jgi:hypothetical protein